MILSLLVGTLLLFVMICVSLYAAATLPPEARLPIHYGFGSYNNFAPKTVGLIMWPAAGALVYGLLVVTANDALKPNHASSSTALIVLPAVLALLVVLQLGAISAARRSSTDRSE
jgi:hypothetical protein